MQGFVAEGSPIRQAAARYGVPLMIGTDDETDAVSLIHSEGERQIALTENAKAQHVSFKQALVKAAYKGASRSKIERKDLSNAARVGAARARGSRRNL